MDSMDPSSRAVVEVSPSLQLSPGLDIPSGSVRLLEGAAAHMFLRFNTFISFSTFNSPYVTKSPPPVNHKIFKKAKRTKDNKQKRKT
jgi:hypothetical protein